MHLAPIMIVHISTSIIVAVIYCACGKILVWEICIDLGHIFKTTWVNDFKCSEAAVQRLELVIDYKFAIAYWPLLLVLEPELVQYAKEKYKIYYCLPPYKTHESQLLNTCV